MNNYWKNPSEKKLASQIFWRVFNNQVNLQVVADGMGINLAYACSLYARFAASMQEDLEIAGYKFRSREHPVHEISS